MEERSVGWKSSPTASALPRNGAHNHTPAQMAGLVIYLFIFAVPELELRTYTLSHSTSPFL
jgi:hypothetical protein